MAGTGHPDHVTSCLATMEAIRAMPEPPRLLHARFPVRGPILVDAIVDWLTAHPERFVGTPAFGHAFKLFTDGTSMLGVAADHLRVEWFPAGSFIIEQGEPAAQLFCILSGSAVDRASRATTAGCTIRRQAAPGASSARTDSQPGDPRNAHVIANDDVTCLVLAPETAEPIDWPRCGAAVAPAAAATPGGRRRAAPTPEDGFSVDVTTVLDRKVAALAAHRSQYAMEPDLLPRSMLERMLGTEHFVVADRRGRPSRP